MRKDSKCFTRVPWPLTHLTIFAIEKDSSTSSPDQNSMHPFPTHNSPPIADLTSPVSVVQNKSETEKDSSGNETDSIGHSPHSSLESYTCRPPSFEQQQQNQNPDPPLLMGNNGTFVQEVASDAYQPNSDMHQLNFSFHRTVIEEVCSFLWRFTLPTTKWCR